MICPNCESRAVDKLSAAYAKGTRIGERTVTHSAWARRCAPPAPRTVFSSSLLLVLLCAIPILVFPIERILRGHEDLTVFSTPLYAATAIIVLVVLITFVFKFFQMLRHYFRDYQDELDHWSTQWICKDCGEKFSPKSE